MALVSVWVAPLASVKPPAPLNMPAKDPLVPVMLRTLPPNFTAAAVELPSSFVILMVESELLEISSVPATLTSLELLMLPLFMRSNFPPA